MTAEEALRICVEARAKGERPNLGYANLSDADLSGANLRGADLRGADLRGADLRGADLRGADLGYAYLRGADLRDADLSDADLGYANLGGADLGYANLGGADLRYADLRDADLRDADLGDLSAYVVPGLDAKVAEAALRPGALEMLTWHSCETTHCRAGWAITLAGEKGRELEERVGPAMAGALIYHASTGRVPDFYCDNATAAADIAACAAKEKEQAVKGKEIS